MSLINELLGPQVAIIDNNEAEIKSIEYTLNEMSIGNKFFEVDYQFPNFPDRPLNTVKLVFLDLYYNNSSLNFEPEVCCDWLRAIVPVDANYILIVWSNDSDKTEELVEVMKKTSTPMPYFVETIFKNNYQKGDSDYDIIGLFRDLNLDLKNNITFSSTDLFGQIISVEKNSVLINCLIHQDPATFEVRRFDVKPFQGDLKPELGKFIKIKISNRPGNKSFDFTLENSDLSELFKKSDDFEDIDDLSFLDDESEADENNL